MVTPHYTNIIEARREGLRRDLDRILPGASRLVLEIGCGHGHFLTAYAAAHPDRTCIGIDLASERVERAEKKRLRAKLANLHFLQAEARLFVDTLPPSTTLSGVFILFPDPGPKLRHNKHRILQSAFLRQLAAHAELDCPLYFRTDFAPYFAAALETFAGDPHWQLDSGSQWPFECETVFQQRADDYQSLVARCKSPVPPITRKVSELGNGNSS